MREKSGMKAVAFTLSLLLCASLFLCNFSVYAQDNGGTGSEVVETSEEQTDELSGENNADTSKEGVSQVEEGDIDSSEPSSESDQKDEKTEGVFNEEENSSKEKKEEVTKLKASPVLRDAKGEAKEVKTTITNFRIENSKHETVDSIYYTDAFYLAMDWETDPDTIVHEGDYFTITLPDEMKFQNGSAANFDLLDGNNQVIAKAQVNPGPDGRGGNVVVTFTSEADNKYKVHGDMYLSANFVEQYITLNEPNTFSIQVGSNVIPLDFTPAGPQEIINEHLFKWGYQNQDSAYEANWTARINHVKADLKNVVITDTLGDQEAEYIKDSFRLSVAEYNSTGSTYTIIENIDLTDKLEISEDGKSFTINLGDTNGKQYRLSYRTTYIPGMTLRNNVTLTSGSDSWTRGYSFVSQQSGGSGAGELANKIKIIKVDEDDNTILLAGAEFEITRPNGTTFTLTTDSNGEAVSEALIAGDYKVKEVSAPAGYILDDQERTLTVTNGQATIETITNKSNITSIKVSKTWVGEELNSVTVHLYADGTDTGQSAVLNAANDWSWTFDDLQKINTATGSTIQYTVQEDTYVGYEPRVSGTAEEGFVITNTQELIDIEGKKSWDDNNNQDGVRPERITIRLLANGKEVKRAEVSETEDWSWSFTDLPKYENGTEITYSITEDAVSGYTPSYDGYNVTNTHTPGKTSVAVSKAWDDNDNQDGIRPEKIIVKLLADGSDTGETAELSEDNNWTASFTDLDEYQNGEKVAYNVEEEEVTGYTGVVTGDAETGYTITNTHTPDNPPEGDAPTTPSTPSTPSKETNKVDTGDNSMTILIVSALAVLIAIAGVFVIRRRRHND